MLILLIQRFVPSGLCFPVFFKSLGWAVFYDCGLFWLLSLFGKRTEFSVPRMTPDMETSLIKLSCKMGVSLWKNNHKYLDRPYRTDQEFWDRFGRNNIKILYPSYKTDLDFWDCFEGGAKKYAIFIYNLTVTCTSNFSEFVKEK